ncbi:MAG: hypothetical protein LBI78_07455 [Campylobacteraceae bacterium]|jgi:hypothetical protein|nr:hypothetical protein [Campylobacteraceae bacterium]
MKRYISVDIQTMKQNGLNFEKWALLENIYFLSNNTYHACYSSKKSLAEYLGISERKLYLLLDELVKDKWLIKTELNHLKVTSKWLNLASCKDETAKNAEGMQNLQENSADTLQNLQNDTLQNLHIKEESSIKNIYKKNIINNIPKSEEKKSKFIPPTLQEIEEYFIGNSFLVNAKFFFDYFTTSGWVDSNGKKVLNWKQKALTWQKKELDKQTSQPTKPPKDKYDIMAEQGKISKVTAQNLRIMERMGGGE